MTANDILKMQNREAFAAGVRAFGQHFGHVAAGVTIGIALGLFAAWVLWLFWFAAVETWTLLVSPLFMAVAEFVFFVAVIWIWRLMKPAIPE